MWLRKWKFWKEVAVEKGFAASAEGGSQGGYEDWE